MKMIAALALALSAMTVPALAQSAKDQVDLSEPDAVAAAMQRAGYKAEIKAADDGSPYISSGANGSEFTVSFYGCKKNADCTSLTIGSWWKKKPYFNNDLLAEWNDKKRFVKLWLDDDGDLRQDMDLSAVGTVSQEYFADTIDWYVTQDVEVGKLLSSKEPPSAK